ncbi:hypothetical protein BGX38DRAFT_1265489 [Terfezia claveryi]|nr:hypothetical protein BGX38DRAFT_1265489 [Terfezia claveryi]
MTSEELEALKAKLVNTPKKKVPAGKDIPEKEIETREIVIGPNSSMPEVRIVTPPATKAFWDKNESSWYQRISQILMGNLYDLETPEIVPPITEPVESHEEIGRKLFEAGGKSNGKSVQYEEEKDEDYETDIEEISEKDMPPPPKDRKKPTHTKKSKTPDKKSRRSSSGVAGGGSEDPGSGSEGDESDNGFDDERKKVLAPLVSSNAVKIDKGKGKEMDIPQLMLKHFFTQTSFDRDFKEGYNNVRYDTGAEGSSTYMDRNNRYYGLNVNY